MRFLSILGAGALAAGVAAMPAPAEARTYVSIGIGTPYYGGGYYGRGYGRGFYGPGYGRGFYGPPRGFYGRGDRGYNRGYGWGGRTICREGRWGRVRCFRR